MNDRGDEFVGQEQQHPDQVGPEQQQREANHTCHFYSRRSILLVDIPDRLKELSEAAQYSFHR
jgi:hypothetical protein